MACIVSAAIPYWIDTRVILGDSERQVTESIGDAARTYSHDPVALHLRAMNMLYEGLKQNSTIVIVPSTAVDTMELGGLAGMTALNMGIGQDNAAREIGSVPLSPGNGLSSENGLAAVVETKS